MTRSSRLPEADFCRHIAIASPGAGEGLSEIADDDVADIAALVRQNARELAAIDANR